MRKYSREQWRWRNLRAFGIGFEVWPMNWRPFVLYFRDDDRFGGHMRFGLGPLDVVFHYNCGSKP